ncbi:DNA-directed RNA polymerases I, II, and III subunit RPABC3-like [Teleopsis dalmanni]|uniref:DNA-directed RNA polymerases I, II, and III subunit RPABC3-like n=1 Tax=Teleopsis dalmanni TaxID=139649 RepID=UPI0018CE88A9|nr:DNA-directed RNA polymerases I, II, and III subunit RPABC3-like [Teleopsis dalmanni]
MANAARDNVLYDDIFTIEEVDPGGKNFESISRIVCRSLGFNATLLLDVYSWVFSVEVGINIRMVIVNSLNLDGSLGEESYVPTKERTLADDFDYVMHGRFYQMGNSIEDDGRPVSMHASFGGLLMSLTGDPKLFELFVPKSFVYLMLKRTY